MQSNQCTKRFFIAIVALFVLVPILKGKNTLYAAQDVPTVTMLKFTSALYGQVEIPIYLPPNYNPSLQYPTIYCNMKSVYFDRINFPVWLDSAITAGFPPVIAVGISIPDTTTYWQLEEPYVARANKFIAEELVPAVEKNFAARPQREARLVLGFSSGSVTVIDLALQYPDVFGRVAAQSPGWMAWDNNYRLIQTNYVHVALKRIRKTGGTMFPIFWFMWGDAVNNEWENRSRENGERMMRALHEAGATVHHGGLVEGGHGLHLVNKSLDGALQFLLGEDDSRMDVGNLGTMTNSGFQQRGKEHSIMSNEQRKQEVWNTVQALNRAWTVEKNPEKLTEFFHPDMVAISGGAQKRIEGEEACIAAWKSFVDNTTIHSWKEIDPTIQIYGNTTVVTYYYEIVFDMKGKRYNEGGRDMFVLVNERGKWLAVANHFSSYPRE